MQENLARKLVHRASVIGIQIKNQSHMFGWTQDGNPVNTSFDWQKLVENIRNATKDIPEALVNTHSI